MTGGPAARPPGVAPRIETARLVLRPPRDSDLDPWMRTMNTPAVTRHLGGPRTEAQVREDFRRDAATLADEGHGFWILEHRATGELVGKSGLTPIAAAQAPAGLAGAFQIGWSLAEGWWRQGLASEAARAVLAHAFGPLRLEAVFAQTSLANEASWRLMEKLGMQRAAHLDYVDPAYPPEENPTMVYRMDRPGGRA